MTTYDNPDNEVPYMAEALNVVESIIDWAEALSVDALCVIVAHVGHLVGSRGYGAAVIADFATAVTDGEQTALMLAEDDE